MPVLQLQQDCYQMTNLLPEFDNKVPVDDEVRARHIMETVAQNLTRTGW